MMIIRPFAWRDIPALHRYREQCVFLHSTLLLTRGTLFLPGALISMVSSQSGIATYVSSDEGVPATLIGQVIHNNSSPLAQLSFLAPRQELHGGIIADFLDYLTCKAGEHGAHRLLADVDEDEEVLDILRQAGFAIYTRQRVWKITDIPAEQVQATWKPASERDVINVRMLYNNTVPALVQQVEAFPSEELHGLVYRHGDELLAYVEFTFGHRGIWIQPLFHPDTENVDTLLAGLLQMLPGKSSRPIYVGIRSYLSWIEPELEMMGAKAGPRQAVMVKYMAITQKAPRAVRIPAIEGGRPEVTTPIAHLEKR